MRSKISNPLLVIVGMCGSGKSTVAKYLQDKKWNVVYFGDITIQEVRRRGLDICEDSERQVREEVRQEHGLEAYAKLSLPKIKEMLKIGPTVIDGLYSWSEYKFLTNKIDCPFYVLAIFTTRSTRYDRIRARKVRPLSSEETKNRDFAEIEKLEKGGPIAMADITIVNDGDLNDLYAAVEDVLTNRIKNGH